MGTHADKPSLDEIEVAVEDFFKSLEPIISELNVINFQLELLKGTLGVVERNVEEILEDSSSVDLVSNLISTQVEAIANSAKKLEKI
jgi:hypothetical protein